MTNAIQTRRRTSLSDERRSELRAQYLACSYLLTACEQAAEKLRGFRNTASGRTDVPDRALDILLAVQNDWSVACQDVSTELGP